MAETWSMKRGRVHYVCGGKNAMSHLFIEPDWDYGRIYGNFQKRWRRVFVLPSAMVLFKQAKVDDVVYYNDTESEKTHEREKYTQATKVITEHEFNNPEYKASTVVLTPSSSSSENQKWGHWTGQPYDEAYEHGDENYGGRGSSMSCDEPPEEKSRLCKKEPDEGPYWNFSHENYGDSGSSMSCGEPPEEKPRQCKEEPVDEPYCKSRKKDIATIETEQIAYRQRANEETATKQPENKATITTSLEHFDKDFTILAGVIPITYHNAIGAITDYDTMGFVMPYAEIAARIKVYNVKGYNTARFSLESSRPFDHFETFNQLQPNFCDHDGLAYLATDITRFHGTDDLRGLLRSKGYVHDSGRHSKDKNGWHHYSRERCLETLRHSRPQNFGGADFRVMTEFTCKCWNSCRDGRSWCYTRSGCTNYAMTAFWIFPAENCSGFWLY